MNTSLLRVRNESKAYFAEHKMVKSFYWGDFIDIYAENQIEHSTVVIQATRVTNMNRHNVDIQVFISYADRVFSDHSNLDEVQSQAIDVLNDFVMVLTTAPRWREFVTGATSGNAELFFNRTGDLVAGAVMTVTISTKTTADLCAIPVRDYDYGLQPQPLPTCDPVTYNVEYADGTPIASGSEPSGGNIEVIVPEPLDAIAEVYFEDELIATATIPSGGTDSVEIGCSTLMNAVKVVSTWQQHKHGGTFKHVGQVNGKDAYEALHDSTKLIQYSGTNWQIIKTGSGAHVHNAVNGNEEFPWLATWLDNYLTVTQATVGSFCTNGGVAYYNLKDTDGNLIAEGSISEGDEEDIIAPDGTVIVNRDGVLFTTQAVTSGGTATVNVPSADWARPTDWLPMPTVTSADQTFVGLHAVIEDGDNYVAFNFTTSTGQYQVDWGDGTVDLINSGVNAEHQYDFANPALNGTLTSRGYKQAMITVTPVSGDLLTCDFQQIYVTVPAQNQAYSTGFLDCILSMPNASSGESILFGGATVRHSYVERFDIKTIGGCTAIGQSGNRGLFLNCSSLQSVPLFDTSGVNSMREMFQGCSSLRTIPLFDTANVTGINGMLNMFNGCVSLQSVPLLDMSNVTNMTNMFNGCRSLQSVPLFNTANVTRMSGMFNDCFSLNSIPALSTASITTDFGAFFARGATSLNRCQMVFQRTVSFQNCQLSRDAIVEIFNNLATVTSATITITGNWGVTALSAADLLIATSKGWTVIQ